MERQKTFDDELKLLLEMLMVHSIADDDWKKDFFLDIADWFDTNALYLSALDLGLHQEINHILEDGIITDEENDTLTDYISKYLNSHVHFDYATYKRGKQRLTREELKKIVPYSIGDKDFIDNVVVVTGTFERFPIRKNAEIEIRQRGGKTSQNVSGTTTMLICGGSGVGWRKVEEVKERNLQGQNIRIIDEETFYKMLESNEAVGEVGE